MLSVLIVVRLLDAGVNCVEGAEEGFEGLEAHLEGVELRDEYRVTTRSRC